MKMYLVLISENNLRDTQVFNGKIDDDDIFDNENEHNWRDYICKGYIGTYCGESEEDAICMAKNKTGLLEEVMEVIEIN